MSAQPPRRRRTNRDPRRAPKAKDDTILFGIVPAPGERPAIAPVARPAAFIESLDPLPLRGGRFIEPYIAAVVERAAGLAIALTAAAELGTSPVLGIPTARDGEAEPSERGPSR